MGKAKRIYTLIGKRIASLAKTKRKQRELGRILGRTQQAISYKLRGESAITCSELEKLAKHYGVSVLYFFEEEDSDGDDLSAACDRVRKKGGPVKELAVLASELSSAEARKALKAVRVLLARAG